MSHGLQATRTRFAPAPTGWLHLGHVANAIYVWELAGQAGARVLLRIDDHDRQRCRRHYEAALLDDLDWLGFTPDESPTDSFRRGPNPSRQSDRDEVYRSVAASLAGDERLYGCRCARREIDGLYPGTCRTRGVGLVDGVAWRVILGASDEYFDDVFLGPQQQRPHEQCGDLVIRDRVGNWTYQFVTAVDDMMQGIDLVVRGLDLVESTGRQIALARLIGRTAQARFAHHPLVMKSATQKLSKSDGDTAIRTLRERGRTRSEVIEAARRAVGLGSSHGAIDLGPSGPRLG
jgi:glutamyl/glutaminyl-tRNA synthetase